VSGWVAHHRVVRRARERRWVGQILIFLAMLPFVVGLIRVVGAPSDVCFNSLPTYVGWCSGQITVGTLVGAAGLAGFVILLLVGLRMYFGPLEIPSAEAPVE
jgi:hypothetical protein